MVRRLNKQRGAALLILATMVVLGGTWLMLTRLNAQPSLLPAQRAHNAKALNQAKHALIGWVAQTASKGGENNPGRLPCPEANADTGVAASEGTASGNCTLPAIGRLPWRTLGLDKLLDAAGEPLWYVVSPGWAYTSSNLTINSNTAGHLQIDGAPDAAVALIIAPGRVMNVAASAGCTARNQSRSVPAPGMSAADYIECYNTATSSFSVIKPAGSFNDQALPITVADVMPAIEAAIAARIEREIAPRLKNVYSTATWELSSANPMFPYPAPFADPGTSNYQGSTTTLVAGTTQYFGLLPFSSASATCVGDPRCSASFVSWDLGTSPSMAKTGGAGTLSLGPFCSYTGATTARCTGQYAAVGNMNVRMSVRVNNLAMALRQLDGTQATAEYGLFGFVSTATTVTGSFNSDGSGMVHVNATLPSLFGLNLAYRMTMNLGVLEDHPLLDAADATTGWFVRNEWYRLTAYAVAQGHTSNPLPTLPSCTTGSDCLSVARVDPSDAQRALIILAGRSINGSARPSASLGDYLEFGNAATPNTFERQPVAAAIPAGDKRPFNDRIVVVDEN